MIFMQFQIFGLSNVSVLAGPGGSRARAIKPCFDRGEGTLLASIQNTEALEPIISPRWWNHLDAFRAGEKPIMLICSPVNSVFLRRISLIDKFRSRVFPRNGRLSLAPLLT